MKKFKEWYFINEYNIQATLVGSIIGTALTFGGVAFILMFF